MLHIQASRSDRIEIIDSNGKTIIISFHKSRISKNSVSFVADKSISIKLIKGGGIDDRERGNGPDTKID